jgi:Protein of unknown function (DUF2637)
LWQRLLRLVPPLALLGATHSVGVLARLRTNSFTFWASMVIAIAVVACASWLSFNALRSVARDLAGVDPGIAWMMPLCIDFSIAGVNSLKLDLVASARLLEAINPYFQSGAFRPLPIARTYPLQEGVAAYQAVAKGSPGRIVIQPPEMPPWPDCLPKPPTLTRRPATTRVMPTVGKLGSAPEPDATAVAVVRAVSDHRKCP